eukprot:symbB.v1.2.034214.t1/scaffold4378.1/size42197/1
MTPLQRTGTAPLIDRIRRCVCVPVKEQKPALGHFNVSETISNGGGGRKRKQCHSAFGMPELASEIFVVHSGLPMDTTVALQDINAVDRLHDVPIKNCALLEYSKRQKVVTKANERRPVSMAGTTRNGDKSVSRR